MTRQLDTKTLNAAAEYYAGLFMMNAGKRDRVWVMEQFFNFTYDDEHRAVVAAMAGQLGPVALVDFEARAKKVFEPRDPKVFEDLLATKLAIDVNGKHIPGQIGTVQIGSRLIGKHIVEVEALDSIRRRRRLGLPKTTEHRELTQATVNLIWPIYAGESEVRDAGGGGADPIPSAAVEFAKRLLMDQSGALNTFISNASALLGANAIVDVLDEGSVGAVIKGFDGVQPAGPDVAPVGNLLFTMTCSTTAFGVATDAAPGALKTANTITDDASADFTATLSYVRGSSSNVADTALNDHIDGEAGTSGADWNFNTLAIVSGAVVSATWTITLPEG